MLSKIVHRLRSAFVDIGEIDKDLWCIDGTIVRAAPLCFRWWKKGDPEEQADHTSGCSQEGFSRESHILCDGHSHLLHFHLTPGQAHESTVLDTLLDGEDESLLDGESKRIA